MFVIMEFLYGSGGSRERKKELWRVKTLKYITSVQVQDMMIYTESC
jgi:hypothetical protein